MIRLIALLSTVLVSGAIFAQEYMVDSTGGPLTLPEQVEEAFAAWEQAGAAQVPVQTATADTSFMFDTAGRMGPDTVTLTLQRSGDTSGQSLTVLINPETYRDNAKALVHEAGLVLGLSAATEGLMHPAIADGDATTPQPADIERLLAMATAVPGDITGDGLVGFADLLELASQTGRRGVNLSGDLNGDGMVTPEDLDELRLHYVFTEPSEPARPETPPADDGPATEEPESEAVQDGPEEQTGTED